MVKIRAIARLVESQTPEAILVERLSGEKLDGGGFFYRVPLPPDPSIGVSFEADIEADRTWSLAPDRQLTEVRGHLRPPFPAGRFVVIAVAGKLFRIEFPQLGPIHLRQTPGRLRVVSPVRDIRRCGLLAWGHDKFLARSGFVEAEAAIQPLDALEDCLWAEPFPNGSRATVCLTDHADFDTPERVALLLPLFERTGFRFTKSVFPHSDPHANDAHKNEPGLDDPKYRGLIAELRKQGTEIAYHGFSPRVNAPALEECLRRARLMDHFQPTTWIDHGTGAYLLTRENRLAAGVALTDFLEERGICNYWSYFDIWGNPVHRLSCWRPWTVGDFIREEGSRRAWESPGGKAGLCSLRYTLSNFAGEFALAGKCGSQSRWRGALANARLHWRLRADPLLIYTREGRPALSDTESPWVFDTVLLNVLGYQLAPPNLDRLCRESGVLLAHCYFSRRALSGNVFSSKQDLRLDSAFVDAIEYAGSLCRSYRLAAVGFHDLRRHLTAFAKTRFRRSPAGWSVVNGGDVPVTIGGPASGGGRSLLALPGVRTDGTTVYWQVPANAQVSVPGE